MQVMKEGRKADLAFQVASKLGKEKMLRNQLAFPNMYELIGSAREKELWAEVITDMNLDDHKNKRAARMAIMDT